MGVAARLSEGASGRARRAWLVALALGLALVAALRLGGWSTRDDGPGDTRGPRGVPAHVDAAGSTELAAPATPAGAAARAPVASSGEADPSVPARAGRALLRVEVTWESDGAPAAGVGVRVSSDEALTLTLLAGRTDADGVFEAELDAPARVRVRVDRAGAEDVELLSGARRLVELGIPVGVEVLGEVVGPDGAAVGGAAVWLSSSASQRAGLVVAQADEEGLFRLRDVAGSRYVGARAAGWWPSDLVLVQGEPGAQQEVLLALPARGGGVVGQVRLPDGAPAAGAQLTFGGARGWSEAGGSSGGDGAEIMRGPAPVQARADAAGRFEVLGLPAGSVGVVARSAGLAPWQGSVPIVVGERAELTVELTWGLSLRGTARLEDGTAAAGATVAVGAYATPTALRATAGADGAYELRGVPAGAFEAVARAGGGVEARIALEGGAGDLLVWNPVLAGRPDLRGVVVDASGRGLAGLRIEAVAHDSTGVRVRSAETQPGGFFVLADCPPVEHRLDVYDDGGGDGAPLATREAVVPGGAPVRLEAVPPAPRGARLLGSVVDALHAPVAGATVLVLPDDDAGSGQALTAGADGSFASEPLAAGSYRLEVRSPGRAAEAFGPYELRADESLRLEPLVLGGSGLLVVTLEQPGALVPELAIAGPGGAHLRELQPGELPHYRPERLAPGDYVLRVAGAGVARDALPFTVRAERTAALVVRPRGGLRQELRVERHGARSDELVLRVELSDADGRLLLSEDATLAAGGSLSRSVDLAAGRYVLAAVTAVGERFERALEVTTASATTVLRVEG
ncbi:MAG: carboxypeptidase-like regulatory domain-containing protein [Planctomycetota bacterium]